MKAWLVNVKDEFGAEIVFAETRGKARALALSTDCCEDAKFTDIEVRRMRYADKYYKEGKWHLDWENPKDRIILVRNFDFHCDYNAFDIGDCEDCSAREYCELYKEQIRKSFDWRSEMN